MNQHRNRLQALIQQNQKRPRLYEIRAAAGADEATIYLYDIIDSFWGIGAAQFVKDLNALRASTIHLRINSPGGDVFEARAMATAVAQHPSKIIAHVDGLSASAATQVTLAAREVEMAAGSFFMIHNAWALAIGSKDDMLKMAELLEKVDGEIAADYVRQTENDIDQVIAWMEAETWFTADEAIENGFADRLAADTTEAKARAQTWDLSAYAHAPAAPAPEPPAHDDAAEQAALRAHAERDRRVRLAERIAN
jgi:ATP-dependent Clp protease protease subunit